MFAPLLLQTDCIGKYRKRIALGEIGDGVETSCRQQFFDPRLGGCGEAFADLLHAFARAQRGVSPIPVAAD
jgi:hypothetical protein